MNTQLIKQFVDLHTDLSRYDARMEEFEFTGKTYPSDTFAQGVRAAGETLASLAVDFESAAEGQSGLAHRLAQDAVTVGRHAGTLLDMARRQSCFGAGWGDALNQPLATVREAIDALLG